MEEPKDYKVNLFYFNNTINDYELPESFLNFKEDIKELFHIDSNLNNEIFLFYTYLENEKDKVKKINIVVNTEDDYKTMRNRVQKEIDPETFEEEIQCVVEREIKKAAERIRKCLSSNSEKYSYSKKQDKICEKCNQIIYGNIYKNALKGEEKYYCEKCSFELKENDPMFIIN